MQQSTGIRVASFNIEKSGQSSTSDKKLQVSEFISGCMEQGIELIFLCEIHSARMDNYQEFISSITEYYDCPNFEGGYSNGYTLLVRKGLNFKISHYTLKGLNREIVLVHNDLMAVSFAHFKSGRKPLTASQLQDAAVFMKEAFGGNWAITGDMNWDYSDFERLRLPGGCTKATCWDQTQKSGGILDWCLSGSGISANCIIHDMWPDYNLSEVFDMTGPDHRPVVFELNRV